MYKISKKASKKFLDSEGNKLRYYTVPGVGDFALVRVRKGKITLETYRPEHHPTTLLLMDIIQVYDLTELEDRIDFLSVLNLALLIDDYGIISEHLHKITNSLSKLNDMSELDQFIEDLNDLEIRIAEIENQFSIQEVIEDRAQKNMKSFAYKMIMGE